MHREQHSGSKIFIIFVDAMFTTFIERWFTNAFENVRRSQPDLACVLGASAINSLAT